jgi:hypothetical protein
MLFCFWCKFFHVCGPLCICRWLISIWRIFLFVSSVFTNDQTSKDLTQDFGQIKTKSFLSLFFHMQKYADEKTDLMKFESLLFAKERHKRKKWGIEIEIECVCEWGCVRGRKKEREREKQRKRDGQCACGTKPGKIFWSCWIWIFSSYLLFVIRSHTRTEINKIVF